MLLPVPHGFLLLLAGVVLAACVGRPPPDDTGEGEGEGEGEPPPDFSAIIAAVDADLERNLATGAQVAVWINEQIYTVGNFGTRDPVTNEPVTASTQFCIGSDTKKLTSLAALQRVQDGELTLDTTIADVLPDLSIEYAPQVVDASLRMLLTHQNGGVDWVDQDTETTDDLLRSVVYGAYANEAYALAPPGIFYNYSNPNFSLAGLLVEEMAGVPFADVLEEEVFVPLGMDDTVARKTSVGAEGAGGTGYAPGGQFILALGFEQMWETAFIRPAGMVWSTAADQMKLARFLVDGDEGVLSDALRAQLTAHQVPTYPDLPGGYGFGLATGRGIQLGANFYDVPFLTHGGNTLAQTSTTFILPEQRFAISILSNGLGDDFTQTLVAAVQQLVALPEPGAPEAILPPTEEQLAELEGVYVDPFNVGDITVTSDGTALSISMPLVDDANVPYEPLMTPLSARVHIANVQGTDMAVSFWDGPNGEMYFATRAFVGVRAPAGTIPRDLRGPPDPMRLSRALAQAPPPSRLHTVLGPIALQRY